MWRGFSAFAPSWVETVLPTFLPAFSAAMAVSSARIPDSFAYVSASAPWTAFRYSMNSR